MSLGLRAARTHGGRRYAVAKPAAEHDDGLNGWEREWRDLLALQKQGGQVQDFKMHPFSLRLADNTHYRPDALVVAADGVLEVHEVKGHWEDDARVKIKVAAELYPWFRFIAVRKVPKKEGGGWAREVIG